MAPQLRFEPQDVPQERDREVFGFGYYAFDAETDKPVHSDRLEYGPRKFKQWKVCAVEVAGESHHADELQHPGFAAGQVVALVEAPNEHAVDGIAVEVRDATGELQAGFVPKDDLALVRQLLDEPLEARVLWEWRVAATGQRCSVRLLLSRPGAAVLPLPPGWPPLISAPARPKQQVPHGRLRRGPTDVAAASRSPEDAPPPAAKRGLLSRIFSRGAG